MATKDALIQAFTKAVQNYRRSQLQVFQRDADRYAAQLINQHSVDPELLDDIYFAISA